MGRGDLAGAAHLELASGVVPLRPEDAMTEEWTLSLAAEKQLAASAIRGYQTELRLQRVPVRRSLRVGGGV